MKIAPLALLTVFAASSSAFGLNGGAKSVVRSATRSVSFNKLALVQPVDVQGNRLSTVVSLSYNKHRLVPSSETFKKYSLSRYYSVPMNQDCIVLLSNFGRGDDDGGLAPVVVVINNSFRICSWAVIALKSSICRRFASYEFPSI
jgi:hypothetical protein